jgi:5'-3' exonuclease
MTQAVSLPATPESIALVDLSYLFKKRWHTIVTVGGTPLEAVQATLRDLESLKDGVDHVIICRDAAPYTHRLDIFKDYKANRPPISPEERAARKRLYEEIQRLGYNMAHADGYEADDVIATLARIYGAWCTDVRIVGPDKDAAQCLTSNVTQYIPPVGDEDWQKRDVDFVQKEWGVTPAMMPLYQGLVGDSSDNIPGVRGIGPVKAAPLVNKYPTLELLAAGLADEAKAQGAKPSAMIKALADHWDTLVMSLKLATLDTHVPLEADALLIPREPAPEKETQNSMDDETPFLLQHPAMPAARRVYEEQRASANDQASREELLEREYERERQQNGEHDTTSNDPGDKAAEPVPQRARASTVVPRTQMVKAAEPTTTLSKYGLVTSDLQPMDLTSAYQMSTWLYKSQLYQQYKSEAQIFAVMVRAKELGIGITAALAGFHVIDGKPVASADLLRALAERDPTFMYLYPKEMSATRVVWVGMRKGYPEPVVFPYTIEDAKEAGLVRLTNYGKPSNWVVRPQDMLMKTAASKLARILWPGATMGLYCPEEFGYTSEELDQREAA